MGEWKAQLRLRVRQALRAELEEFAAREKGKLGNLGVLILERPSNNTRPLGPRRNCRNMGFAFMTIAHQTHEVCAERGFPRGLGRAGKKRNAPNYHLKFQVNCHAEAYAQLTVASQTLVVNVGQQIVRDGRAEIWHSVVVKCSEEQEGSC